MVCCADVSKYDFLKIMTFSEKRNKILEKSFDVKVEDCSIHGKKFF